jgi:hypothetical protein
LKIAGQPGRNAGREHSTEGSSALGSRYLKSFTPEQRAAGPVIFPEDLKRHHCTGSDEQRSIIRACEPSAKVRSPPTVESQTSHSVVEQDMMRETCACRPVLDTFGW